MLNCCQIHLTKKFSPNILTAVNKIRFQKTKNISAQIFDSGALHHDRIRGIFIYLLPSFEASTLLYDTAISINFTSAFFSSSSVFARSKAVFVLPRVTA